MLDAKVENRVIDIQGENINETDVWVQSIDGDGRVLEEWEQVPNTVGKNIAFNSIGKDTRKVYEIITKANDTISIKFGDDIYADIPTGNIRVWYRESANEDLTFTPIDVAGKQVSIRYVDSQGLEQDAVFTVQLATSVSSSSGETISQIKNRATRTAASQDRMITASDYNIYPQGQVGGIDKILAVNRTYAGQSIYADIQDPTGTYRPVITLADDGFIYRTEDTIEDTLSDVSTVSEVINWIQTSLLNRNTHQLYYKNYPKDVHNHLNIPAHAADGTIISPDSQIGWHSVDYSQGQSVTHGYFYNLNDPSKQPLRIGNGTPIRSEEHTSELQSH